MSKFNILHGIVTLIFAYLYFSHTCVKCPEPTTSIDTVYVDTTKHEVTGTVQKQRRVHVPTVADTSQSTERDTTPNATEYTTCYSDSSVDICADLTVFGTLTGDVKFTYQTKRNMTIRETVTNNVYIPTTTKFDLYGGAIVSDEGSVSPYASCMFKNKQVSYQYDLRLHQHRVGLGIRLWGR